MTSVNRTLALTGENKKLTISMWVKRSKLGSEQWVVTNYYSGNYWGDIRFQSDDTLRFTDYRSNSGGYIMNLITDAKFRDPNGFYHILCSFDSTVGSPQAKIYVNGELQTLSTNTNYGQNDVNSWNTDYTLNIGNNGAGGSDFKGLISDFYFIQGYEYAPTVFAEEDASTGEWKPKTNASVNYSTTGTNSCHLKFENSANMDLDSGDNNLSFTTSGTLTKTEDCPSCVFATWNGIGANLDTTLTNGNTKVAHGSQLERRPVISALGMSSGKYYAEFKALSGSGGNIEVGIVNRSDPTTQGRYMGQNLQDAGFIAYKFDGVITFDGTDTSGLTTTATNDILGVAVDIDNTRVYFYKNGTLINSGGTSFANMQGGDGDYFFCNGDRSGGSTYSLEANFGNGYFGTTAVSSAGTNASGNGIFEYDVPTGYTALSTKGLNL